MKPADVTIIVTTFNRPEWLAVSVFSILSSAANASRSGITTRILVVDDGSEGSGTRDVAARAGVDYLRIAANSGRATPSFGRVAGLQVADSPFVAFFDDDDAMLPRWIPLHVARLREGHDVCSTAFWRTDSELLPTRLVSLPAVTFGDLLDGRFAVNDGSLMRRSALDGSNLDPELENVMLADLWLDMAFRGCAFTRLDEATFLYRRHGTNSSDHLTALDAETRRAVLARHRQRVIARDGSLPAPTPRPAPPPRQRSRLTSWRRFAGRVLRNRQG